MRERIDSPEKLNRLMKISTPGIWIILIILLLAVTGGLAVFLSRDIVVRETHLCYITDTVKPGMDAMIELGYGDGEENDVRWKNYVETMYKGVLPSSVQIAYLVISDISSTEIFEGMTLHAGSTEGKIVYVPNELSDHEEMLQLGMNEKDMRRNGLNPAASYYLCEVFLYSDEPEFPAAPGFSTATVTLDVVDPVSLILR